MAQWNTTYTTTWSGINPDWRYIGNTNIGTFSVDSTHTNKLCSLYYSDANYNWKNDKTYQFITNLSFINDNTKSGSFSVTTNWSDTFIYADGATHSGVANGYYIFYSSPDTNITNNKYLTYNANSDFCTQSDAGIHNLSFNEIDFKIQGFSYFRYSNTSGINDSLGWSYDKSTNTYFWYDKLGTSSISKNLYPVGGDNGNKISNVGYRLNNYISKFVPYTYFNLSFNCTSTVNNLTTMPLLEIYLSPSLPNSSPSTLTELDSNIVQNPPNSQLIGTISTTSAIDVSFYGLKGNQYIYIRGGFAGITNSTPVIQKYHTLSLKNIIIDGSYHPNNNELISITYSNTQISATGLNGASYSAIVGHGNSLDNSSTLVNTIFSKIGNGRFISGIWENGVWNSGWRHDETKQEFYNISQFVGYQKTKRWRVQLEGPTSSVTNFNIGDNVSIGNIIAIDINENRKLLKNYFTIINKTDSTITVEFDNNFPLRRIEKDSIYHRIYVTKNVWLSGGFLNGYFSGIWNYGLFKGYPLITEMYDTHWIDGVFDGGHFSADNYLLPDFIDTFWVSPGKVGLSFSTSGNKHELTVGDLITISNDTINPQYNTDTYITSIIDNYNVVTDLDWGINSTMEGGSASINLSTGLIQNIKFNSNNISKITSNTSMDSYSIFIYNSWMDLNYYNTSATNIGKPQNLLNSISKKSYSENNLYGYPTHDILSSDSSFRDSFSTSIREYKLGTKYKIFSDFIGDSGNFENYFDTPLSFVNQGWTYSIAPNLTIIFPFIGPITITSGLTFSRTQDTGINNILGEELKIDSTFFGGILEIGTYSDKEILNRNTDIIQKSRYTKVEFDIITFSNYDTLLTSYNNDGNSGYAYIDSQLLNAPVINFTNLNYTKRGNTYSQSTFLPIYKNIEHIFTNKKTKVEYFYNKTNLSMWILGNLTTTEYTIDNLHFYEIDMIPFFQYFTDNNINRGIQIPYQGLSPFIDYTNSNFKFIDNISIGLDSIQTVNSNTSVSGVGVGNEKYENFYSDISESARI